MVDNKVVIRINYDKDRHQKSVIDPKMVTVWHKGRIFSALLLLSLLIGVSLFALLGDDVEEQGHQASQVNVVQADDSMVEGHESSSAKTQSNNLKASQPGGASLQEVVIAKPVGIILDKRVIRASINRPKEDAGIQDSVVVDSVIRLGQNKTQMFDYFSEVKNVKESTLFHRWLKNDRVIQVKQFTMKDHKGKLLSSRKLGIKDVGAWQVVLVDKHGKVLSRSSFEVVQR